MVTSRSNWCWCLRVKMPLGDLSPLIVAIEQISRLTLLLP
jgi:hypothetical protein